MANDPATIAGRQCWQPIETAPKDGTIILLSDGQMVQAGCFAPNVLGDEYPWAFVDDFSAADLTSGNVGVAANAWKINGVSHWQPLPAPPSRDFP